MTSSRLRWYTSVVKSPSRSSSSVATHTSSARRWGSSASAARRCEKIGRLREKTKIAVSDGEKPRSPRVRDTSASSSRTPS
jgi:hypothetical protein